MKYEDFLKSKQFAAKPSGFQAIDINPMLFDFQADILKWACQKGKVAVFAGCGTGKSPIQISFADNVHKFTGKDVLILAPLAVSEQTVREGIKFGVPVQSCRSQSDVLPGVNITNYEMLSHFDVNHFAGVVLDESSILKSFTGKIRTEITELFKNTPYKMACTATPAPNDIVELCNHAEFLGIMKRNEILPMYFVHNAGETQSWDLKAHAAKRFWEWVASWAVMMSLPSDLGYEDNGFKLPPINLKQFVVDKTGYIVKEAKTLNDQRAVRMESMDLRVAKAAELVNNSSESWLVWCNLNKESEALKKAIPGAVEVTGSDDPEFKARSLLGFSNGDIRIVISKPVLAGMGLNLQICHNQIFTGLSHSFEQYYQAVRRSWRFGQKETVNVYVITSEREGAVVRNIQRKEKDFDHMLKNMIAQTSEITKNDLKATVRRDDDYKANIEMALPKWI
jgi:hypothetical protein